MKFIQDLRALYRLIYFALIILAYLIMASILFVTNFDPLIRRKKLTYNSHLFSKLMLKAFNVSVICKNNLPEDEYSLLVGNHIGFIDIVALHSLRSCVFITSLEMKKTPVLGQITDLAGCAYVNRKNRMNIHEELKGVTDVLKQGFRVVLYAEAVASNGEQVLPFKKTLMMSAGYAERAIRPFVFNFRSVNGGPVLYSQRDSLCWYGDETFLPAIWRSLHLDSVVCEVEFLDLILPSADADRSLLAQQVHQVVSSRFVPFYPEMGLKENNSQSSNNLTHSM